MTAGIGRSRPPATAQLGAVPLASDVVRDDALHGLLGPLEALAANGGDAVSEPPVLLLRRGVVVPGMIASSFIFLSTKTFTLSLCRHQIQIGE